MPADPPRLKPHVPSQRGVYALILAAGQSRRMGRPKQTLRYAEGTMLEAVIDAVLESSVDGLVLVANPVIAPEFADALPEDCVVAINHDPNSEMLASAQLGLRELVESFDPCDDDGVLLLLGDQPQVTGGTITSCAEAYRLPKTPPGILIASYKGRRGHPTVFSLRLFREILDWPTDRKLSDLARQYPDEVRQLPITMAPAPLDVNTPSDYLRLRRDLDSDEDG